MKIEETFKQFTTPQELLDALPTIKPLARGDFLKETQHEGHYAFNATMMEGLESMNWSQLYNMTGAKVKGPK